MPELKVYAVEVNGWPTTLQLTAADAAARGLTVKDLVEHRAASAAAKVAPAKARTPANKSRAAANKGA